MGSLDRLEQQKRLEQRRRNQPQPDEEIEEELELPRALPLNRTERIFDRDAEKTFGGINTVPSVFDHSAVFHTK